LTKNTPHPLIIVGAHEMSRTRTYGGILLETAIAVPLLLLAVGGVGDFGRVLNEYASLVEAVRVSARTAAGYTGNNSLCAVAAGAFVDSIEEARQHAENYTLSIDEVELVRAANAPRGVAIRGIRVRGQRGAAGRSAFLKNLTFLSSAVSVFVIESNATADSSCL
jgi:hypothetical protein